MRVYIITLSDKGYTNEREDVSGKVICEMVTEKGYTIVNYIILPDERDLIANTLKEICDKNEADLILTTGGTGLSKRDVTPQATKDVVEYEVPGIAEAMRYNSLQITKRAMLSRSIAGVRNTTLIINLPGSPKAVKENLEFIIDELSHGIDILKGSASECARK
ncbi:molybdenum cofactor biosynthesis protein [Candidatus Epulonipiscium fishelsonii]|uniref:Molybdenum cofactor biosynthesis protein n=1 Tax=Candidatus Epulonipiscium fishelsonii TaxID=77094 RepID=A0ACC8XA58_9FIRM|nr:molybdenum cofactor biosynthesis protein [Epulopiscium sp. SCG-B05WGA-EpuloA1]ONI39068.1 molybdenum cofactor biosynthesis protein [Epulopiscium sp. SCG-B11WGA-EpuloA1]ONI47547.1 molybdenum cofactor biosynthesis protein [Epulopiscium sp. SCG-C06WGA-EpuloA1]